MDTGNNLQMIHEQEGENNFGATQNIEGQGLSAEAADTQVQQIENDINLI